MYLKINPTGILADSVQDNFWFLYSNNGTEFVKNACDKTQKLRTMYNVRRLEHQITAFVQHIFYLFGTYVNKVKFKLLTGRSGKHRMYLVVVKQINIQQRSVSRELP